MSGSQREMVGCALKEENGDLSCIISIFQKAGSPVQIITDRRKIGAWRLIKSLQHQFVLERMANRPIKFGNKPKFVASL